MVENTQNPAAKFFVEMGKAPVNAPAGGSRIATRLLSLGGLLAVVFLLYQVGSAGYRVLSDSVVTPLDLSPASELVVSNRVTLERLRGDRRNLDARIQTDQAAVDSATRTVAELTRIRSQLTASVGWAQEVFSKAGQAGGTDFGMLTQQESLLAKSVKSQRVLVRRIWNNYKDGLARESELRRAEAELNRLQVSLLEVGRQRLRTEGRLVEAEEPSKEGAEKRRMVSPELVQQREELSKITLDLQRAESEIQVKAQDLEAARAQIPRLDELIDQLTRTPVFRAANSGQSAAFVPYADLPGVVRGAGVYECRLWGIFRCRNVGRVTEVLPGEVVTRDPWGGTARGQYLLMRLEHPVAAQAKVLKIRPADIQAL